MTAKINWHLSYQISSCLMNTEQWHFNKCETCATIIIIIMIRIRLGAYVSRRTRLMNQIPVTSVLVCYFQFQFEPNLFSTAFGPLCFVAYCRGQNWSLTRLAELRVMNAETMTKSEKTHTQRVFVWLFVFMKSFSAGIHFISKWIQCTSLTII